MNIRRIIYQSLRIGLNGPTPALSLHYIFQLLQFVIYHICCQEIRDELNMSHYQICSLPFFNSARLHSQ